VRLGVYIDAQYREDAEGRVLTNFETLPFLQFAAEVGGHFDELVLLGRAAPEGIGVDYPVPEPTRPAGAAPGGPEGVASRVSLAPLPFYPSLVHLGAVAAALARMPGALWRGLDRVDVVWCFGPHPFSLALALFGLLRRRKVVLGVRQDTMRYFRTRLRGRAGRPLLAPLYVLDAVWRMLGRRVPVTVVGEALERRYGGPRPKVLPMQISLVRDADLADAPRAQPPGDEIALLTVGRIDVEKNPLLLIDALAELGPRWRLTWVGTGPLADAVRERAARLGIEERVALPGFVPPGPELLAHYRAADAFVHVALTEGVPQVLIEAMATGLPVVATDVGGVSKALDGGEAGLLVGPDDREALVAAIHTLASDDDGRARRAAHGLAIARDRTLEGEARRVARWLRSRAL
jgi:glycosyltransferase involved in cell wall biosynthesis